jgi:hypothetical protein
MITAYQGRDRDLLQLQAWVKAQMSSRSVYPAARFLPRFNATYLQDQEANFGALKHYLEALGMRALEQTSASLTELSAMTRHNTEHAQSANGLANETRRAAESGASGIEQMNSSMRDIQEAIAELMRMMAGNANSPGNSPPVQDPASASSFRPPRQPGQAGEHSPPRRGANPQGIRRAVDGAPCLPIRPEAARLQLP